MTARRYVLALDQGTSGSTAMLIGADALVRGRGYAELPQRYPRPGWVEHDPEQIWSTVEDAARQALAQASVSGAEVAAVGITNQRETALLWERASGAPIHHAIVWQCRRTAPLCDALKTRGLEPLVRARTGLVLDPYFSGTKVRWLLDHVEGARLRAARGELAFGTVDAWLVWKLTGGRLHATDVTNASRTLLLDLRSVDWDAEMLALLDVPREILPRIIDTSGVCAETSGVGWLPDGVPVAGIAGDQQAALFGQACHAPGSAKNTYGTGCFALLNTGGEPVASGHGLLTTIAWRIDGRTTYALEGSVFVAGAAVQWLRDGLGLVARAADTQALAESVEDTGGVYFVPAFVGLGAPYWDPYARGTLVGLTRGTTRAHLVRATLEAIAYQSRDVLDAMAGDAEVALPALKVDGGAVANDFLCQFQADLLGAPVMRPRVIETTALGAAFLAGLATGIWRSLEEVAAGHVVERTFEPRLDPQLRARRYDGWRRAVERSRHWEKETSP
jgi:glycerol kinase